MNHRDVQPPSDFTATSKKVKFYKFTRQTKSSCAHAKDPADTLHFLKPPLTSPTRERKLPYSPSSSPVLVPLRIRGTAQCCGTEAAAGSVRRGSDSAEAARSLVLALAPGNAAAVRKCGGDAERCPAPSLSLSPSLPPPVPETFCSALQHPPSAAPCRSPPT